MLDDGFDQVEKTKLDTKDVPFFCFYKEESKYTLLNYYKFRVYTPDTKRKNIQTNNFPPTPPKNPPKKNPPKKTPPKNPTEQQQYPQKTKTLPQNNIYYFEVLEIVVLFYFFVNLRALSIKKGKREYVKQIFVRIV